MDFETILRRLCGVNAPSGFEGPAALAAKELLEPLMDEVWLDRLGSVVGVRRCGKPGAKKVLLDAHLDEVGLVVTGAKDGFLRFASIGGVDPRILPDQELTVLADPPLLGVAVCLPPHVLTAEERENAPAIEEMFVDVGLSQEEAVRRVPVGTPMVYKTGFARLGEDQISGKALDDRSCFAALLRAAELLQERELDVDLYVMGSVREETGGMGASVVAQTIAPDVCVAVDVTFAKTPDCPDCDIRAGGGPAVGVGPNMTRWLTRRMFDKAEAGGIPVQTEVMEGSTGTNGWGMQVCNEGIATSVVSLPLKYMHTPVETVQLSDMEDLARLLAAFTADLGKEWRPEW